MIRQISDFTQIEDGWNRLYQEDLDTVFQSYIYNSTFWKTHPGLGLLAIIVYYDGKNQPQAILPTYIRGRQLRFINDSGTDFCDIVYNRDIHILDVVAEIIDYIRSIRKINCIILENLRSDSPLIPYFKILSHKSMVYSNNEYSFLMCEKGKNPFETGALSGERKKKIRKVLVNTATYPFKIYRSGNQDFFPEEDLKILSRYMVKSGLRSSGSFSEGFWTYVREAYSQGIMEVAVLYSEKNEPLSAGMVFVNASVSVRWIILYTDGKYNLWNNIRYIDEKSKYSSFENNFGRGGYDYKIWNFKPVVRPLYKVLAPTGRGGIFAAWKDIVKYYLKRTMHEGALYKCMSRIKTKLH